MRYLPIYLLLLPLLWSCSDERFAAELVSQSGPIKYLFMADIDTAQVESRVALEPLDHGHSTGHYHDLSLHWEEGDKVTLKVGSNEYEFTAELLEVNGVSRFVFTYRGTEEIANAANCSGIATYTPSISENPVAHQSENSNSDHLKNYGPALRATLTNVNLTSTADNWVESGKFTPIRFSPDFDESEYAYFKIEVNGFKYPIWGGGTVWVYILQENVVDYSDYHEPWAKITFGTAPTNMVNIKGSAAPTSDAEKYMWPNLQKQDPIFKLGTAQTKYYTKGDDGYPIIGDDGKKKVDHTDYMSISFPNTLTETPFISVPEYYIITPKTDTNATDYSFVQTAHPEYFEDLSQHYKLFDIQGNFYVPVKKTSIKGASQGDLYIATVMQCGWSGDLYVWEKKVPTDIDIVGGKFYVLDYSKHKPEYAIKFAENTYFRSTFLEQNFTNTDAPRYTLFGEKAVKGAACGQPNCVVGPDMMTPQDVQSMMKNSGAFMHQKTPMCAIFSNLKKVKWEMTSDTTFARKTGSTNLAKMIVYKTNNDIVSYTYDQLTTSDLPYSKDGGYWDKVINRADVLAPDNYVTVTQDYMQKITKGIINTSSVNFTGKDHYNSLEYVLLNRFDPVMNSTKTCNLWRAPYGADIYSLCDFGESVFFRSGKKFVFESSKTGHRICVPNILAYSASSSRGTNTDGTGKGKKDGTWQEESESNTHFISGRSVRTFGSNNPAYMQALDISYDPTEVAEGKIGKFGLTTKFNMAFPVLPVFRWELSPESTEGVVEW